MSKSNISNGETQAEVDVIENNNEWKVSTAIFLINNLYLYLLIFLGSQW
jgi:hypothetical protein